MRPCTRRIVPAEGTIKATSLNDALGEHAPWCRTAPNALPIHIKPLAERDRERDEQPGRDPGGERIARLAGADEDHEEPLLPRSGEATELPHREIGAGSSCHRTRLRCGRSGSRLTRTAHPQPLLSDGFYGVLTTPPKGARH